MQATIAAARSGSKTRFRTQDFMMEYGDEKPVAKVEEDKAPKKSWQELKFIAQMWVADSKARRK
jgi:hypothetical protein